MKIELKEITVRELVDGYYDDKEGGVRGYSGNLDIRPPFQREFVYKDKQREAVIDTISKGFPLNVMYWAVRNDETYEVIDGQQRTISIAQYVNNDFSFDGMYFANLQDDQQARILDYTLSIYLCSGADSEKLEWFKTINIAGERLTDQELRNAVYAGTWVSKAKKRFSRTGCPAYEIGKDYMKGSPIRQDYLETVLRWKSGGDITDYMGRHQHEPNAVDLWIYFRSVIDWVQGTFPAYRKSMQGVDWGPLYDAHKDKSLDADKIEAEVAKLVDDEDVTKEAGIYPYVLTRDEKHLSIRAFSNRIKQQVYERQDGKCSKCEKRFSRNKMEADHIKPWVEGGRTIEENCQMLCKPCNRRKSSK